MPVEQRRYYASEGLPGELRIFDRAQSTPKVQHYIAVTFTKRMAKLVVNALNLYRPKVRRRKSAEKSK